MGNIGFRSGKLIADRLKSDGQYVVESNFIRYEDLNVTYISGVAAVPLVIGTGGAQGLAVYSFNEANDAHASFRTIAPISLKSKTKCRLGLIWTSGLSGAGAGKVVWDVDYWSTSLLMSGTFGREPLNHKYNISGSGVQTGNSTATSEYQEMTNVVSGVLQRTNLEIPAGDISAGDLVNIQILRDTAEAADTLFTDAALIGVLVEYLEG